MCDAVAAERSKSAATKVIGWLTLLYGGRYAILGGYLILVWTVTKLFHQPDEPPPWLPGAEMLASIANRCAGMWPDRDMYTTFVVLFSALFLGFGIMVLLVARSLLQCKRWGRFLTLIVAVMAIPLGLRSMLGMDVTVLITPTPIFPANIPLGLALLLYGLVTLAILNLHWGQPAGIYILGVILVLMGLPAVIPLTLAAFSLFNQADPIRGDIYGALAIVSMIVAGLLVLAAGMCLLTSHRKERYQPVRKTLAAAAWTQVAMAVFVCLAGMLGPSIGDTYLMISALPLAIFALVLTASGARYLKRPNIRRALESAPR